MGKGAWRATVHRVAKSRTQLKRLSTQRMLQGSQVSVNEQSQLPRRKRGSKKDIRRYVPKQNYAKSLWSRRLISEPANLFGQLQDF